MKKIKKYEAAFLAGVLLLQSLGTIANAQETENYEMDGFIAEEASEFNDVEFDGVESEDVVSDDAENDDAENEEIQFESEDSLEFGEEKSWDDEPIMITESGAVTSGAVSLDAWNDGISLFSLVSYTDSYGSQLEGNSKAFYDKLVENYIVNYADFLDTVTFEYTLPDAVTFEAEVQKDEDGKATIVRNDAYIAAGNSVKSIIQAATDAFSYDYPQAFWFRGCSYQYKISASKDANNPVQMIGRISAIEFHPENREISTNAHQKMADFMTAVQKTVSYLEGEIQGKSEYEKVKIIHDYICKKVTYTNDGTLWVHTAASLFLDPDPGFVCEGYAKSMKILCYYLGINCACVSGLAKSTLNGTGEAHMWNYIRMEDGKWYMVDATWDDSRIAGVFYDDYLLVGRNTKGRYITIGEEREEYTSFSTSTDASVPSPKYILPVLEVNSYLENIVTVTPTPSTIPVPSVTEEPLPSEAPSVSEAPTVSEAPAATEAPLPSEAPSISKIPTLAPTATAAPKPSATPTAAPKPSATPTAAPKPSATPTAAPKPSATPTAAPKPSATPTAAPKPSATPTAAPKPSATPTVSPTAKPKPSATPSAAPTAKPKPSATPTVSPTAKPKPTATPIPSKTTALTLRVKQSYKVNRKLKKVKTSNSKVAVISSKTGKITAKKAGKATITVTYTNGKQQIFNVKVQNKTVKTTALSVKKKNIILQKKGKTFQLKVNVFPVTSQQKVTYKSSNKKVATVSAKGKITARKKGNATITIKSGSKKIICKVTVRK